MSAEPTRENIAFSDRIPGIKNTLAALSGHTSGRSMGLKVEEIMKQTGLNEQDALKALNELERKQISQPYTSQEGTSGPYAIRYRLIDGIEVAVTATRPLAK